MPRWSHWRLLANKERWFGVDLDYDGPACYELGVGRRVDRVKIKYVGETGNERQRMAQYGYDGSHLRDVINRRLDSGENLYYRSQRFSSREAAVLRQNNLLDAYDYDWNIQRNVRRVLENESLTEP